MQEPVQQEIQALLQGDSSWAIFARQMLGLTTGA